MKIILFGSTGMLGNYVLRVLKKNHQVICINRDMFDIEENEWEQLYIIINNISKTNDILINCAGLIPQKNIDNDINLRKYISINTLFPHKLCEIAKILNLKFIHITTDCVFNGSKGNYTNNDNHNADTLYGITKSLGEPSDATIIRTSIIGEEISGKKSLLEWVKNNKNCEISGYTNHYWNGVTCLTLANIICEIIDKNLFWKGVKHIFSPNIVNKFELCCFINNIYNLNIAVKEFEAPEKKTMTLYSENIDFKINDIYKQIEDLKEFQYSI